MKVFFKKIFLKDFVKLPKNVQAEVKEVCFDIFPKIKSLSEFKSFPFRKMEGFQFYWRIKVKDFRIGFEKNNGEVIFMRVLSRKDIYKSFP
jgi:mRNA interferase RelE/StbE